MTNKKRTAWKAGRILAREYARGNLKRIGFEPRARKAGDSAMTRAHPSAAEVVAIQAIGGPVYRARRGGKAGRG